MPVSSEYLEDLVLDLNISAVERSLHTLEFNKQFALDVANGMCAECCEWFYCQCE